MDRLSGLALAVFVILIAPAAAAEPDRDTVLESGTVQFRAAGHPETIPERYRLDDHTFPYQLGRKWEFPDCGADVFWVRFPSPVTTRWPENNMVHAEYYRPRGPGPFPCVIVLDITGGDQRVSRSIATHLAQNRIAGLFVQMAFYGPRRPPGSKLRLVSTNYSQTMAAVRQTVLDLRRATAWMESRPEIDPKRLGILGTSLGSFIGCLTAEMEPRLHRVAVLLGGGGLVDAFYDHPQAAPYRKVWEALGGTKEQVKKWIAPVNPLTCAANLKDHDLLILAGSHDEIVPPKATQALWEASGRQQIVWFDSGHYTAVFYFPVAVEHIVRHFGKP